MTQFIVLSALENILIVSRSQSKIARLAHTRHNRDSGTPYSYRRSIFIVYRATSAHSNKVRFDIAQVYDAYSELNTDLGRLHHYNLKWVFGANRKGVNYEHNLCFPYIFVRHGTREAQDEDTGAGNEDLEAAVDKIE